MFLFLASSFAQLPVTPTECATDTQGFLSEPTRQALNTQLTAFEKTSGHQILVWVGTTTGETPLVLFLFTYDRTARIEVGYGLEEKIPDALASRVLRETASTPITPPLSVLQIVLLCFGGITVLFLAIRYPVYAFDLFALLSRGGGKSGGGGAS